MRSTSLSFVCFFSFCLLVVERSAYIRDSSTADDSDIDAACDDLSSAQVAGTITFLCATFQLFRIWLRFCSFRNVSVWSLSIVPLVCVVQRECDVEAKLGSLCSRQWVLTLVCVSRRTCYSLQ